MFLVISKDVIFAIIAMALVQQPFAIFSIWMLLKKEPPLKVFLPWNFVSVFLPFIGPLATIIFSLNYKPVHASLNQENPSHLSNKNHSIKAEQDSLLSTDNNERIKKESNKNGNNIEE